MKKLKTKYMGIELDNPIIIGASNMATDLDKLKKAEELGAAGIVYKSLFEEQIQLERLQLDEKHIKSFNLSNEGDYKKSLRYAGLLFENIKADICSSHGIFTGADVIKLILSGSSCVQVVSTLYKNGLTQIKNIKKELAEWMDIKNYKSIDEFRGKLSKNKLSSNPFVYIKSPVC